MHPLLVSLTCCSDRCLLGRGGSTEEEKERTNLATGCKTFAGVRCLLALGKEMGLLSLTVPIWRARALSFLPFPGLWVCPKGESPLLLQAWGGLGDFALLLQRSPCDRWMLQVCQGIMHSQRHLFAFLLALQTRHCIFTQDPFLIRFLLAILRLKKQM